MKKTTIIMAGLIAMAISQPAIAGGDHKGGHHGDKHSESMQGHDQMEGHGDMHSESMQGHDQMEGHGDMQKMEGTFLAKKEIDGFTVSFHAMKVKKSMQHGGTHNVMVKVEKDGKALTDLIINSKVTHPNGNSESKMLMRMGDWYMAGYDLDHDGQHQLMVLFKTADGAKHFGGVYFPKDSQ